VDISKKNRGRTPVGSMVAVRGVPDPQCRSRLRQDSAFFFRTRMRTQNFVKNRTQIKSHFSISAGAEVCVVIS